MARRPPNTPSSSQRRRARRYLAPASALAGTGLLVWLVTRLGPAHLLELWTAVRSILPYVVALTGLRYLLQAAGWRLAIEPTDRPGWWTTIAGVIAGESAGYVAGGVVAREPIKLLFVQGQTSPRSAITGAAVERLASIDRKSTRLNSSHIQKSRMPSSA